MSSPTNSNSPSGLAQAEAAQQNRQHRARVAIMEAITRLGIRRNEWPDFIETHYGDAPYRSRFRQIIWPPKFQPPAFDRLNQSAKEWAKDANAKWERHRDEFLQRCELWEAKAVDDKIPETKGRGPGKSQRSRMRQNTPMELRHEWAALRSCGQAWKEIAAIYHTKESTVIKAASEVLRIAGWPTKPKPRTPGNSIP